MIHPGRILRDRRGVVSLEFTLVFAILLLLSLGALELGLMMLTDASLEMAIRAASRSGMIATDTSAAARKQKVEQIVEAVAGRWVGKEGKLTIETQAYPNLESIGKPTWVESDGIPGCNPDGSEGTCPSLGGVQIFPGLGVAGGLVLYRVTIARPGFSGVLRLAGIDRLTFSRQTFVLNE